MKKVFMALASPDPLSSISLASPWIIGFIGMIASVIVGLALTIVAQEYFSYMRIKRVYRYV